MSMKKMLSHIGLGVSRAQWSWGIEGADYMCLQNWHEETKMVDGCVYVLVKNRMRFDENGISLRTGRKMPAYNERLRHIESAIAGKPVFTIMMRGFVADKPTAQEIQQMNTKEFFVLDAEQRIEIDGSLYFRMVDRVKVQDAATYFQLKAA